MNVIGLHPSCWGHRQAVALLASGILEAEESASVQAHLAACPRCRGHHAEMKSVADSLRRWEHDLPDITVSEATHQRWMQAIIAEAGARERGQSCPLSNRDETMPACATRSAAGRRTGLSALLWLRLCRVPTGAAAGLAIVWLLILFFNLTAPAVPKIAGTSVTLSPAELFAVLKAQAQATSRRFDPGEPVWFEPPKPATPRPRSESERGRSRPPDGGLMGGTVGSAPRCHDAGEVARAWRAALRWERGRTCPLGDRLEPILCLCQAPGRDTALQHENVTGNAWGIT